MDTQCRAGYTWWWSTSRIRVQEYIAGMIGLGEKFDDQRNPANRRVRHRFVWQCVRANVAILAASVRSDTTPFNNRAYGQSRNTRCEGRAASIRLHGTSARGTR